MAWETVPRKTSSCSFVSSRQTAMGRSPRVSTMSCRAAFNRCGVSRATRVRSWVATDASSFSRSDRLLGRKPRYTKLSPYMPDTESAAVGAEGPGTVATVWPASAAASTSQAPGSLMPGEPASVTRATSSSASLARMAGVFARLLCSL